MRKVSEEYVEYLKRTKEISKNTEISYRSDLDKMIEYFNLHGIFDYQRINETNLNSYILSLELKGNSGATITRNIAVMKGYFDYLFKTHRIKECITDEVRRPVLKKNPVMGASRIQANKILEIVQGEDVKSIRDFAMLQLFCNVGIPVSELINLQVTDVNSSVGYVQSTVKNRVKTYAITSEMVRIVEEYLEKGRPYIVKGESTLLFSNMQGQSMSRQGVWKMVKTYAKQAGLEDVNPAKLCKVSEI